MGLARERRLAPALARGHVEIRQDGGERLAERARRGRAVFGALGERTQHDALELGVDAAETMRRRRLFLHVARDDLQRRLPFEGRPAAQELVEQHARGVDVRAVIEGLGAALLGRHVRRRADPGADAREHGAHARRRLLGERDVGARVEDLRDAEVEHAHALFGRRVRLAAEHDVLGFDVAVHDALLVRVLERGADVDHDLDGARLREGALGLHARREVVAEEQLHRHVGELAILTGVQHAHDVRVLEALGDLRLAQEARDELGVVGELGVHDLDRHVPGLGRLHAAEHLRHAALADERGDLEAVLEDTPDQRVPRAPQRSAHRGGA